MDVAQPQQHMIKVNCIKNFEEIQSCKGGGTCIPAERYNKRDKLWNQDKNICHALLWKRFRLIDWSEISKIYENAFILKNYKTWEFIFNFKSGT